MYGYARHAQIVVADWLHAHHGEQAAQGGQLFGRTDTDGPMTLQVQAFRGVLGEARLSGVQLGDQFQQGAVLRHLLAVHRRHCLGKTGAVIDHAGNAVAAMDISFATAARPHYSLLITEVNSNAKGGDFFELYNYGSTSIDLSGWCMTDEAGQFSSAITLNGNTVLAAGATLVVADAANLSAFKTAWGLSSATSVVSVDGPGLGKEDAVVLFDKLGNVAAAFNYDLTAVLASDGTLITTASASGGKTFSDGQHAGAAFGADVAASAVWDGLSTIQPTYCRRNGRQGRGLRSSWRCSLHWLSRRRAGWTVCAVHRHPLANLKDTPSAVTVNGRGRR